MTERPSPRVARGRQSGFSLVELLVVMGIIALVATIALPRIGSYMRNYQLKGAAQQVTREITTARSKAISKNVNYGVVFYIVDATHYRWVIEDDVTPPISMVEYSLSQIVATTPNPTDLKDRVGPLQELPARVRFGTGCTGFTANAKGFRYNRFGGWCMPGVGECPTIDVGAALMQNVATSGSTICITETRGTSTIRTTVVVAPGGRVQVQ